jgi:hypothetical protein
MVLATWIAGNWISRLNMPKREKRILVASSLHNHMLKKLCMFKRKYYVEIQLEKQILVLKQYVHTPLLNHSFEIDGLSPLN